MTTTTRMFGTVAALGVAVLGGDVLADAGPSPTARPVDLALCLDTSGSMDGLIDAARQKLWTIVNDLALAEPTPELRVALLTYGNNDHPADAGWVAVQTGFTSDLDLVSEKLFALRTNGGEEYVGRVLHRAGALDWHPSEDALRLVIVAGNESADQDEAMPFRDVCRALIGRGIVVNPVFCGTATDEAVPGWQAVATLADGRFALIDQDEGTVVIETPYDEPLAELSAGINATYLPFGAAGRSGMANQAAQDANAANLNAAAVAARCGTKGSGLYDCAWDLVDASRDPSFVLADVEPADLPEVMRTMTADERRAHVEAIAAKRAELQARIRDLTGERAAYVAAEMRKRNQDDANAFDHAVRRAVRDQAVAKGFRFADDTD